MKPIMITAENVSELKNESDIRLITHNGVFHADDVMSTALLIEMITRISPYSYIKVDRVSDADLEDVLNEEFYADYCVVYDIGGGDFDHHQSQEYREGFVDPAITAEKHPYASFGKLWRALGPLLFDHQVVYLFDKNIADKIDLCDNGIMTNPLSILISTMNPAYGDESDEIARNKCFDEAVSLARVLIDNWLKNQERMVLAKYDYIDHVTTGLSNDGHYSVFEKYIPENTEWLSEHPELLCTVFPSARTAGAWVLMTTPVNPGKAPLRKPLPESWKKNAPTGCTFVHDGLFLAEFDSKKNAIAGAKLAVA